MLRHLPIRRKLMAIILVTSGVVMLLMRGVFFGYEYVTFRSTIARQVATLGEILADNSTAALAFENHEDAQETLSALKAERHVVAAALYDRTGNVFARYPETPARLVVPAKPGVDGYRFSESHLTGFQPVVQRGNRLGTLYLDFDTGIVMREWIVGSLQLALGVMAVILLIAYLISRTLQKQISQPILELAETARAVSERRDYSVRGRKLGDDELGLLTDAFNHMLTQIHEQDVAVREGAVRVRAVLDAALSAVIVVDAAGKIIDWNARAETIFGWTRAEVLGRDMMSLVIPPERRALHAETVRQYLAVGESPGLNRASESSALRRLGGEFPVELSVNALRTGATVTFCWFITDITERKRSEASIQQLNLTLENRVKERTAQLELTNKELEAFSYSVSHDLRAPLRHIDGFAAMLMKNAAASLDEKSLRHLTTISTAAQRMGRLIDDLLAFSRMGRAPLGRREINHDELIAEVVREGRYGENKLIEWQIAPLPIVLADVALLRQVWANLIDNAVKYSGRAPRPRIEIGVQTSMNASEPVFYIRDNGVGFDMKYADKLFGVFQRLHSNAEFPGTGIGLANVHRIITRHGGRLWAESRPGEGATFYFTLPSPAAP